MLKEYLRDYGYSDEQINKITNNSNLSTYTIDTLLNKVKEINSFFEKYGFTRLEIIKVTARYPQLYGYSLDNIVAKINYFKLEYSNKEIKRLIMNNPAIFSYSYTKKDDKYHELIEIGFNKNQATNIIDKYKEIYGLSKKNISDKLDFFKKFGFSDSFVFKLFTVNYKLFGFKLKTYEERIKEFNNYGFTNEDILFMCKRSKEAISTNGDRLGKFIEYLNKYISKDIVIKIIRTNPNILTKSIKSIEDKKDFFIELGYTESQFFRLVEKFPFLLNLDNDNINEKINTLKKLGLNIEQIILITIKLPSLLGYSPDNILLKVVDIMDIGFTKQQTVNMLINTPQLFGYSINNISEKVEFLKSVKLDYLILNNSNILIPSKSTTEKRYNILKQNGEINTNDFYTKNKDFESKYKMTLK